MLPEFTVSLDRGGELTEIDCIGTQLAQSISCCSRMPHARSTNERGQAFRQLFRLSRVRDRWSCRRVGLAITRPVELLLSRSVRIGLSSLSDLAPRAAMVMGSMVGGKTTDRESLARRRCSEPGLSQAAANARPPAGRSGFPPAAADRRRACRLGPASTRGR